MPRRTKACAICRQKRIKCDATMPHCLMCLKYKRDCPGPTDAPLMFIDTSSYPSGKKPRKRPSPPSSRKSSLLRPVIKTETSLTQSTELEIMQRSSTRGGPEVVGRGELPPELAYVTLVQISGKYVLNEALFANLVRFFCAEGRYTPDAPKRSPAWLYSLPRMAVQPRSASPTTARTGADGGQEALALALCATTAAYSGIEARNTGMLEYASRLYGEALRAQGRAVAGHAGGKKSVGMDMVAASVMLGMFEAVVATTGRAYAEHVVGAAKMLDVAMSQSLKAGGSGPPRLAQSPHDCPPPGHPHPGKGGCGCADGSNPAQGPGPLLTHIFFHTRIQLAFVYLTSTEKRIRSDAVIQKLLIDVCGWPYEKLPLDQQVIRPLALLIGSTFDHENYKDGNVFSRRRAIYWEAQDAVSTLWSRYSQASSGQNLFWTNQSTGMMDFREPFSAIQHAFFSACRILLERLSPAHNPTPTNASPPTSPTSTSSSFTSFLDSVALPLRTSPPPPPSFTNSTTPSTSPSSARSSASASPLLPSNDTHPHSRPQTEPEIDHCALILSVAAYLRARDVGFSYLRIHLPLCVVALYAPKVEQRRAARRGFEEWERGALRGIGALGLERLAGM